MTKYVPPIDVDFGAPLPVRVTWDIATWSTPARELHILQLSGYSLIAGVRDGEPFVVAPGSTKEEVRAALQAIVEALEALQ